MSNSITQNMRYGQWIIAKQPKHHTQADTTDATSAISFYCINATFIMLPTPTQRCSNKFSLQATFEVWT